MSETGSSKLAGFVGDKGQSHVDFGEFLSLLDHESPQATRTIRDDDRRSSSARPNARKYKFPFYFSMNHHQRALLRLGITTAVRQVTPALLWKKEYIFSKNTRGRSRSSQEKAQWRSAGFKESSKTSSKPNAPEFERLAPNFTKAR